MRPPPSRTRAGRSPTGTGPGRGRALRRTDTTRPRPRDRRPPQAGRRVCTSSLTGSGTIAWLPLRGYTRMQSGRTDQAKKFTKVAGSAPEREGSTWQFSTGFPTWAGLRLWPDPGRILGGSWADPVRILGGICHALARGITCRRAGVSRSTRSDITWCRVAASLPLRLGSRRPTFATALDYPALNAQNMKHLKQRIPRSE